MTGILLINKPAGFTSFDVVAKLRGISKTRRIGHAGTLDPMATGVLPLLFGAATKACDRLPNTDKRYRAELRLGITTDTQDITGTVLSRNEVHASARDVERALARFRGEIMQVPPMYSAVQVGGRRLYDIAREGGTVERAARPVTIHRLELLEADGREHVYTIDVSCSKGTYIRTLCHDLGQELGCGATLTGLCRTEAAGFGLEQCLTLEQAQRMADAGEFERALLPVSTLFAGMQRVTLDERRARLFCNGVRLDLARNRLPALEGGYAVYGPGNRFLGLAHNDYGKNELHIDQLFPAEG
ncbi:tRNA pseudouridine(55) synthase TruB [Clostridiaceae bacterium NSJ-31]|uniref:tRNA pseudouridine synthase B n=1 Tax=Ligaoa zhengdingensis TaxID=2763658 RepID=A0A926I313_9FIRM|nr:tRNA pseudouridine(55) synthase TruB [Ligaoa zhengdingensis]MBC8545869.1 tRNA pseudouridine(55) synthase TruB [Ligaoa zhengdingensis]